MRIRALGTIVLTMLFSVGVCLTEKLEGGEFGYDKNKNLINIYAYNAPPPGNITIENALKNEAGKHGLFLSGTASQAIRIEMTKREFETLSNNRVADRQKLDILIGIASRIIDKGQKKGIITELIKLLKKIEGY